MAINLEISDESIRKTVNYGFKNLFITRLNSPPSFFCVSSPLTQDTLALFRDYDAYNEVGLFFPSLFQFLINFDKMAKR